MEHDLTTPDGFAAHMREKEAAAGAAPPESPEAEEPVAAEEAVVPEPEEGAAPEEGEGEAQPSADPSDPNFSAGYAKALGEQSERLGAERAAREAAEAELARVREEAERATESVQTEAITEETWGTLEEMYESQGGAGMMLQLASDPNASEDLIDAGIALWKENDYRNAALFEKRMDRQLAAVSDQPAEPVKDPDVVALKTKDANAEAVATLTSEYGREKLEQLQPHLAAALDAAPSRLKDVLGEDFQSGDKERIVEAFRTLVTLAEPLAAQGETPTRAAAKKAATVGTGSQASVAPGQSELPTTPEELQALDPDQRRAAAAKIMAQRILGQETSVAAELAKNKSGS